MPLPPPLSEEQRREALAKAATARRKRADLKEQLKHVDHVFSRVFQEVAV